MAGSIRTHLMSLKQNGVVTAQHLPCRLDPVNTDIILNSNGLIPTDSYDCTLLNRTTPLPNRGDYLIDEAAGGATYQIFGSVWSYVNKVHCRVTRYLGVTP